MTRCFVCLELKTEIRVHPKGVTFYNSCYKQNLSVFDKRKCAKCDKKDEVVLY